VINPTALVWQAVLRVTSPNNVTRTAVLTALIYLATTQAHVYMAVLATMKKISVCKVRLYVEQYGWLNMF
jgi:hypothetical protein